MKKLKKTLKEYLILSLFLISIIGGIEFPSHSKDWLEYLDANNLYGWAMPQKLPVDGFEWVEENDLLKFNASFIKKL